MRRWRIAAAVIACACPTGLLAQKVSGPVLGYVWDAEIQRLRPLLGTPGAAIAGERVRSSNQITLARASHGNSVVVIAAGSGSAGILDPESGTIRELTGVRRGAEHLELSPEGTAAAFYFPQDRLIQVVSGLPIRPSAPADISLTPLRNPLQQFTVSDDGAIVLCLEGEHDRRDAAPAAVALSRSGDLNRILLSGTVNAAAFRARSHDALLAGATEVVWVRDVVAGARTQVRHGSLTPTVVAFSPDGHRALLADHAAGLVAVVDLRQDTPPEILPCDCNPISLLRLSGGAAYALTEYSRSPLRLLDLSGERPRVTSVPSPIASNQNP